MSNMSEQYNNGQWILLLLQQGRNGTIFNEDFFLSCLFKV